MYKVYKLYDVINLILIIKESKFLCVKSNGHVYLTCQCTKWTYLLKRLKMVLKLFRETQLQGWTYENVSNLIPDIDARTLTQSHVIALCDMLCMNMLLSVIHNDYITHYHNHLLLAWQKTNF